MKRVLRYVWNVLQALDRMGNALSGGTDKEYISSRVYRYKDRCKVALALYTVLNWIERRHCEEAYKDALIGFDPKDAVLR
jgi:hypothetical protein